MLCSSCLAPKGESQVLQKPSSWVTDLATCTRRKLSVILESCHSLLPTFSWKCYQGKRGATMSSSFWILSERSQPISSSAMDSPHGRWASTLAFHLETGSRVSSPVTTALKALESFPAETGLWPSRHCQGLHVAVRQLLAPSVEGIRHVAWRLQKVAESIPSTQRTCMSEPNYRPGFSWVRRKF